MTPSNLLRSLLPAILLALALWSCDESDQVAGRSDETHSSVVDVQGRVLTRYARPLANVVVRLRAAGLQDTTDNEGAFRLLADLAPVSPESPTVVDTLDYLREGQIVASVAVPEWIYTAPDLMLVQRDLAGAVEGKVPPKARFAAVIVLPGGTTRTYELEWNRVQRRYSGFAYFRYSGTRDSFQIRVQVLDDSGRLLARSALVHFTSLSGDIEMPSFAMGNILPEVFLGAGGTVYSSLREGLVVNVPRGDVRLWARLEDTLGRLARMEWSVDGSPWTVQAKPGIVPRDSVTGRSVGQRVYDTTVRISGSYALGDTIPVLARVFDKDGAFQETVLRLHIVADNPYPYISVFPPTDLSGDAPTPVTVHFQDGAATGRSVARRILHLARRTRQTTAHSVTCASSVDDELDARYKNPWGFFRKVPIDSACRFPAPTWTTISQDSVGRGVEVSGKDTVVLLPAGALREYALVYTVVDEYGESGTHRSRVVVLGGHAPDSLSVEAQGDSMVVRWSAVQANPAETWIVEGFWDWRGIPGRAYILESFRLELPGTARRAAFLRPFPVSNAAVWVHRQAFEVHGPEADRSVKLAPPWLTFTGVLADPARLHATARGVGPGEHWLGGAIGSRLLGEIARLDWSLPDSAPGGAGVEVDFDLPADSAAASLTARVANPGPLPLRLSILAPSDSAYSRLAASGIDLGWTIPAGFEGVVELPLADVDWPDSVPEATRPEVDRTKLFAALRGVRARLASRAPVRVTVEFDDLRWIP